MKPKTAKKEAKKKGKAAPTKAGDSPLGTADQGGDVVAIEQMLKRREPISLVQRSAFRGRFSDAQCDKEGGRTKSKGVLRDGKAFASTIEETLAKSHNGLRYDEARFVWMLECLLALAKARAVQSATQGSVGAARKLGEQARGAALEAREDLLEMLGELAGGVQADRDALAKARGTTTENADLAVSLRALADLAKGWLDRPDKEDKELVRSSKLSLAHVDQARRLADDLNESSEQARKGRLELRDGPDVNRAEGRVLREMAVAMKSFAAANRKNRLIPKLVPGPATRTVLGKLRAASDEEEASGEEATAPEGGEGPAKDNGG